jgi:uncharacterized protein (DUF302 family)
MAPQSRDQGADVMRTVVSSSGYGETLRHVLDGIERRGLTVFAQIDHAAAAREVGMELAGEVVVLFGNPRAGTPLMQQDPRVGIELPLRLLIWNEGEHTVLGYNDPRDLAGAYSITAHAATLDAMSSLLDQLAHETAGADSS